MARKRYQCNDCSASFGDTDDVRDHEGHTDHEVVEVPPEGASDRERQARGFEPRPEPTEGHVTAVDGQRVGRRRADY